MAFAFRTLNTPLYEVTRVEWSPNAKDLLRTLNESLKENWELPVQDLRLRLQVRDARVVRLNWDLGRWANPVLLFTESEEVYAKKSCNAAAAEWARDSVATLEKVNEAACRQLQELAWAGEAFLVQRLRLPVFQWDTYSQNNTAKPPQHTATLFANLADFVASILTGKEVYPEASPMRREVSTNLENEARLVSDPIEVTLDNGSRALLSVGLTISVETYPGRALPIIKINHRKAIWARVPEAGYEKLSGFAFPVNEYRALRFEVNKDLSLTAQYAAIARQYNLPMSLGNGDPHDNQVTATELGLQGCNTDLFKECNVVITHRHGQGERDVAGRGVTDLDRQLSFEKITELLKPYGFFPWDTLFEVPTVYKQQQDADSGWKFALSNQVDVEDDAPDERYVEWARKIHDSLQLHYNGVYHFILAYQNGLQQQALKARDTLYDVLGTDRLKVHLEALPEGVHGPKRQLSGEGIKPAKRAEERISCWKPFIKTVKNYMVQHENIPVKGVLIIANKWYGKFPDDSVNKRAARVTLNRELGLVVQYLLPTETKKDGNSSDRQKENFRMRTVNAWKDMTWKSIGKMHGIRLKLERSLGAFAADTSPVVLGIGLIQTNRTKKLQNDASFIPYAIELNPSTGTCQASMLLQEGNSQPKATPMLDLAKAVRLLTANGPSYLSRKGEDKSIREERKRITQKFLHDVILERSQLHQKLIVLADASTLRNYWDWLTDKELNPFNIKLNGEIHIEQDFPDTTFVRIRYDHAPKVIMDAPQVRVRINDTLRPAARRSEADLYRLTDVGETMPIYLSFGTKISKQAGGTSSYRPITKVDKKTSEEHVGGPWTDNWSTPNAIEITVVQHPKRFCFHPDHLAQLVEALRSEYGHYGSWTKAPGPLHFSSFLKEYVPDYDLEGEADLLEDSED